MTRVHLHQPFCDWCSIQREHMVAAACVMLMAHLWVGHERQGASAHPLALMHMECMRTLHVAWEAISTSILPLVRLKARGRGVEGGALIILYLYACCNLQPSVFNAAHRLHSGASIYVSSCEACTLLWTKAHATMLVRLHVPYDNRWRVHTTAI